MTGLGAEEVAIDHIPESLGARQSAEESTSATGELGGGKQLASTVDGSVMVPRATTEATGPSAVNAGDANAAPESRAAKPIMPEEQTPPLGVTEHGWTRCPAMDPSSGASSHGGGG